MKKAPPLGLTVAVPFEPPKQLTLLLPTRLNVGEAAIVTAKSVEAPVPQELVAATIMFPPDVFANAEIVLVVDAPVQPPGNVHV